MASSRSTQDKYESWLIDQVTKSEFFHQKLHEYGLLEVAYAIEDVQGENLDWNKEDLGISEKAWKKVIHRGIKPVRVFAHPDVLSSVHRSVGYYQKLALVSLKSMNNIGLTITTYESGQNKKPMNRQKAEDVCRRLNKLISRLIESDDVIDPREFDLWRGMTAGSTAQGSWQNKKGDRTEDVIKGIITRRIQSRGLLIEQSDDGKELRLKDSRVLEYGSEPDLAFYDEEHQTLIAVEIKGGIHGMFRTLFGRYSSPKSQFRFPEPFQSCRWPKVPKMGLQEPKSGFLPQIAAQKRNRLFRRDLGR